MKRSVMTVLVGLFFIFVMQKLVTAQETTRHILWGPLILLIFFIIAIPCFIFWLVMLIDCINRDMDQKAVWILILLLIPLLGAIVYYFAVRRKEGPNRKR